MSFQLVISKTKRARGGIVINDTANGLYTKMLSSPENFQVVYFCKLILVHNIQIMKEIRSPKSICLFLTKFFYKNGYTTKPVLSRGFHPCLF